MVLSVSLLTIQVTTIALHMCGYEPAFKVSEKRISDFLPQSASVVSTSCEYWRQSSPSFKINFLF